jgi:hypothetical protein
MGMSVPLRLGLEIRPVHRVPARVLVAPFFAEQLPPRGPLAFADWRLCGLLTDRLVAGEFSGGWGSAALIPTGGRLLADFVLALGLGQRHTFSAAVQRAAAREATLRLAQLQADDAVLALLPETGTGLSTDLAVAASGQGAAEALTERPFPLRLRIRLDETEQERGLVGLRSLSPTLAAGVDLHLEPTAPRRDASPGDAPGAGLPASA